MRNIILSNFERKSIRHWSAIICASLFVYGCNNEAEVIITKKIKRTDAPTSKIVIDDLIDMAPMAKPTISGDWFADTIYSPTLILDYKMSIELDKGSYDINVIDADTGIDLDVSNVEIDFPVIRFDTNSGLFGPGMVPKRFSAELVVLENEIKGHFKEPKVTVGDEIIEYHLYDTVFVRIAND